MRLLHALSLLSFLGCHVGPSVAGIVPRQNDGRMILGFRSMGKEEEKLVKEAGSLIQSRNTESAHLGKAVYVGNAPGAFARPGTDLTLTITVDEAAFKKAPKVWVPGEFWNIAVKADDAIGTREFQIAERQLIEYIKDQGLDPAKSLRVSFVRGYSEVIQQILIPNDLVSFDERGVANGVNNELGIRAEANKPDYQPIQYDEEWDDVKGPKKLSKETVQERVKQLQQKASKAAADAAEQLKAGKLTAEAATEAVETAKRSAEGIGHMYRASPEWVDIKEFDAAHEQYANARKTEVELRKTELTQGIDAQRKAASGQAGQAIEESDKLLRAAEDEANKLKAASDKVSQAAGERQRILAENPRAVWARISDDADGGGKNFLDQALKQEAAIAEAEHKILQEGVDEAKKTVEDLKKACSGRKRDVCGGSDPDDERKKGDKDKERGGRGKGQKPTDKGGPGSQPGGKTGGKDGKPPEGGDGRKPPPTTPEKPTTPGKPSKPLSEVELRQASDKFAEQEFKRMGSKYGLEKYIERPKDPVTYPRLISELQAKFKGYEKLQTTKFRLGGKLTVSKLGGSLAGGLELALWVKELIGVFSRESSTLEQAAVGTSIVPVIGCGVKAAADNEKGKANPADVAICAAADVLTLSPAWPVGLFLHALRVLVPISHFLFSAGDEWRYAGGWVWAVAKPTETKPVHYLKKWEQYRARILEKWDSEGFVEKARVQFEADQLGVLVLAAGAAGNLHAAMLEVGRSGGGGNSTSDASGGDSNGSEDKRDSKQRAPKTRADADKPNDGRSSKNGNDSNNGNNGDKDGANLGTIKDLSSEVCNQFWQKRDKLQSELSRQMKQELETRYGEFDDEYFRSVREAFKTYWQHSSRQVPVLQRNPEPYIKKMRLLNPRTDAGGGKKGLAPGPGGEKEVDALSKKTVDKLTLPGACTDIDLEGGGEPVPGGRTPLDELD